MRTYIYEDERTIVTRVEGRNPHREKVEFRLDGTRVTLATFEYGRPNFIAPGAKRIFPELVKLYHQHQYPELPDDDYYRMVVDNEDGTHRYWIKYKEGSAGLGPSIIQYHNNNIMSGQELLLQADEDGNINYTGQIPLWLVQVLVSHARNWFNV